MVRSEDEGTRCIQALQKKATKNVLVISDSSWLVTASYLLSYGGAALVCIIGLLIG